MSKPRITRSRARLAAAQALYQMEFGGEDAGDVVSEFRSHRLGFEQDAAQGETLADADEKLFADIVNGVVARQVEIDRALYMNEREIRPNGNFMSFRHQLHSVLAEIARIGRREMPLAAE